MVVTFTVLLKYIVFLSFCDWYFVMKGKIVKLKKLRMTYSNKESLYVQILYSEKTHVFFLLFNDYVWKF